MMNSEAAVLTVIAELRNRVAVAEAQRDEVVARLQELTENQAPAPVS